jgi:hypothetical protein
MFEMSEAKANKPPLITPQLQHQIEIASVVLTLKGLANTEHTQTHIKYAKDGMKHNKGKHRHTHT